MAIERTYRVLGVPLRTGSLYPGSENDAQAYRDVNLIGRLQSAGCRAIDEGDIDIPSYLPHHSVPPIRNWPGPRIAWDCVTQRLDPLLAQLGQVPLLIGCDCSVIMGTTQALLRLSASPVYVFYLDGDFDDASPDPAKCQSAAATAVWLLTNGAPFWTGPALSRSQVKVIGWTKPSLSGLPDDFSLAEIRRRSIADVVRQALVSVPPDASIVIHFDIDVLSVKDMPAAYFPHDEGLTLAEAGDLLAEIARDPRVRIIEVSEYAALRDLDRRWAAELSALLAGALRAT